VPILERLSPNAWVEMNPRDARVLRLKAQDKVDVVSRRGRVRNIELRITETIAPGQVFVPFHYAEANANEATQSAFDPVSREPNYKQSAVRVEKVNSQLSTGSPTNSQRRNQERLGVGGWSLGAVGRASASEGSAQ
jgi:assimilatory nitrate reductase catalytic subunit